jgi:ADP-ribosylation factor GTPase-activating protein 1
MLTTIQLAETDLAAQARLTAASLGQTVGQTVTAVSGTATETFNRFVEGEDGSHGGPAPEKKDFWESFGAPPKGPAPEKKDFWDSFSDAGAARAEATSLGTSAMKSKGSGGGPTKKDEDWGEW